MNLFEKIFNNVLLEDMAAGDGGVFGSADSMGHGGAIGKSDFYGSEHGAWGPWSPSKKRKSSKKCKKRKSSKRGKSKKKVLRASNQVPTAFTRQFPETLIGLTGGKVPYGRV
jgi:hypothetical protein